MLTALALVAFAANSVLCRMALGAAAIDPASFTLVRLASGSVALLTMSAARLRHRSAQSPQWWSGIALFVYAIAFSWAYQSLTAGTGALVLFGAVQTTMVSSGLVSGERPDWKEWTGLVMAVGGLVYLVTPGLSAPPLRGFALMSVAGVAWGLYSLWGRRAIDPVADTRVNFTRTLPLAVAASALTSDHAVVSMTGMILGAASGALASGLGYIAWYAALRDLTATRAAIVQLAVPVLAALAGVLLLGEAISLRLVVSALLILGGIGGAWTASARQ